jgi:UPF0755 protein
VPYGSSVHVVAKELQQQGLISYAQFFVLLAYYEGVTRNIQAGEYEIKPGVTPNTFLKQLVRGDVIMRAITLVEGRTFEQYLDEIESNPYLNKTLRGLSRKEIMKKIAAVDQDPEGQLMANTYHFAKGTDDVAILAQAYRDMQSQLTMIYADRSEAVSGLSQEQLLILASMVEREAAKLSEFPKIAGVLIKRLQKNMRLQVDASVIYALGKNYQGKLTKDDLAVKSEYNTYLIKGLPPTPIATPSIAALQAVAHPELGSDLYYVAKGDGSHEFSKTYAEHRRAIVKYLKN